MMNRNFVLGFITVASGVAAAPVAAQEVLARVLTSTAVMQQVAVPRQVCTTQPVIQQTQPSGAGAAMGAIAGGAVGHSIGGGSGRDVATVLGIIGGAVLGNRIEGTRDEVRNVQQCTVQTTYETRVLHYDVIYEYDNKRYSIKMLNDPGAYVRLQMNPVGALPAAPAGGTTIITRPISSAPVSESTVTYVQNDAFHTPSAAVHVHPVTASAFTFYPAARYVPVAPAVAINWSLHTGHPQHHHNHRHQRHHRGHWN